MNNFRQIYEEYKESFLKEHSSVWNDSLKPLYCVVVDGNIETSNLPYILDSAQEEAFVICKYTYTVITQPDKDWFMLYMNANGKVEDYIIKDGWKFQLNDPQTGTWRSCQILTISKDNLKLEMYVSLNNFDIQSIWKLFEEVRKCSSKIELDYLKKLYDKEQKIERITRENAELAYKKALLEEKIKAYEGLLSKIEEMVSKDEQ